MLQKEITMTLRVADMTVEELEKLVRQTVQNTLIEMLGDPDAGLELRESVRERLQRTIVARNSGTAVTIPAQKVAEELGLRRK